MRLKLEHVNIHVILRCFQYQKGAIKTIGRRKVVFCIENAFNTKKVRLKHLTPHDIRVVSDRFQYQKGAIKTTVKAKLKMNERFSFNTKKVRLKLHQALDLVGQHEPFNTKKVRLKHRAARLRAVRRAAFNTKKVRLKPVSAGSYTFRTIPLSIPKRCD